MRATKAGRARAGLGGASPGRRSVRGRRSRRAVPFEGVDEGRTDGERVLPFLRQVAPHSELASEIRQKCETVMRGAGVI